MPSARAPRAGEALVRLVTSFETSPDEIDRLLALCHHPERAYTAAP